MSQIKVARYSGVKYEFVDGYARVPVLEGEFDQAHFAHCALQPGCSITPEVYSVTEHNQLFIFTKGKGYFRAFCTSSLTTRATEEAQSADTMTSSPPTWMVTRRAEGRRVWSMYRRICSRI